MVFPKGKNMFIIINFFFSFKIYPWLMWLVYSMLLNYKINDNMFLSMNISEVTRWYVYENYLFMMMV